MVLDISNINFIYIDKLYNHYMVAHLGFEPRTT